MAAVSCFPCGVACSSGSCLIVNSFSDDKSQVIDISAVPPLKTAVKGDDNEDDDKAQPKDVVCKNKILCMAFSRSGKYFAVCDDEKRVLLYQASEDYRLLSQRCAPKRCSAITFTHDESYVLVADRHGDVYRFSVTRETEEGKLLMGHLSMLLDIVLTRNDQYIVTCDRDEKIRISNYPNAYNIHSYCLKHTEYVTSLVYEDSFDLIISGGGDGKVMVWSVDGQLKTFCDCRQRETTPIRKIVYNKEQNIVACIYHSSKEVNFYKLLSVDSNVNLEYSGSVTLQSVPWDVDFDIHGRLWVLQPLEGSTVQVYRCCCNAEHNNSIQIEEVTLVHVSADNSITNNSVTNIASRLNSQWDFFKESCDVDDFTQYLKKKPIDSFAEYLQDRKDSKPKRDLSSSNISECDQKKTKVS